MFLKLAWRNIWRNKRRSLITIASILFAVFFALIMRTMQLGTYDKMIENTVRFYSGYIQIHAEGYWDEKSINNSMAGDTALTRKIRSHQGVEEVVPRLEGFALSSHGELTHAAQVVGIDIASEIKLTQLNQKLVQGKLIAPDDRSIMVGEGLADYYGIGVNDTLVLLGQGYHGVSAAGKYPIKGILDFKSPQLNDRMVYLPMQEAQWFYSTGNRYTSLALLLGTGYDTDRVVKDLKGSVNGEKYEVMGWKTMMPELVQTIQADSAGGIIMLLILYMVITFGIFGTVLMMTAERKYEFGVMLAVGMKRGKIATMLLLETIAIAIIGVIAGNILAYPLIFYFNRNPITLTGNSAQAMEEFGFEPVMPTSLDPSIAFTHAGIILVISLIITLYPAVYLQRLSPVKAMKD